MNMCSSYVIPVLSQVSNYFLITQLRLNVRSHFRLYAITLALVITDQNHSDPCNMMYSRLQRSSNKGDYKHWIQTRGLETQGQGTQGRSCVALSFYNRDGTCVNVLSSNVQLYRCES